MIDTENISLEYKYSFAKLKQLTETINKRDSNCSLFPGICLMSYNFGDIKFGYISDLDILSKYFSGNNNDFKINIFPNSSLSYPVKGWIFVVPEGNENIQLANEFFKTYLSESINNNTGLRNNTLSAVNNIYEIQKSSTIYKSIIENEENFDLIQGNINDEIDTTTLEMLKGNYNTELFIKN